MPTDSGIRTLALDTDAATRALIERALVGDVAAVRSLVTMLTPAIRFRTARVLARGAKGRNLQASVDDLTQQVLLVLFAEGGKVLLSWDPQRRLPLVKFVGLVAERQALAITRSERASPFTEEPTEDAALEQRLPRESNLESQIAARELFHEIAQRMRLTLSPYGLQMFELLFLEEKSVEQVSDELGMSADAVYAWRSRLIRDVRAIADQILSENQTAPRTYKGRR